MLHIHILKGFPYTGIDFYFKKAVMISQDGDLSRCKEGEEREEASYSWTFKLQIVVVRKRKPQSF